MRNDDTHNFQAWRYGIPQEILDVDVSAEDFTIPQTEGSYRIVMVATAGDVAVTQHNGQPGILPALQPGVQYVFSAKLIRQTGTVATGIRLLR